MILDIQMIKSSYFDKHNLNMFSQAHEVNMPLKYTSSFFFYLP